MEAATLQVCTGAKSEEAARVAARKVRTRHCVAPTPKPEVLVFLALCLPPFCSHGMMIAAWSRSIAALTVDIL